MMVTARSLLVAVAGLALALAQLAGRASAQAPGSVHGDRLAVKLVEGSGAVLENGVLHSRSGVDLSPVATLFARARAEHLIRGPLDVLDRWHARAHAELPEGKPKPGHLALWFRLRSGSTAAATALLAELEACPLVASCEREPVAYTAGAALGDDPPPTTPLFTSMQVYVDPAPSGVGSRLAQGILGGRGRGVTITVVEFDWITGHEDLDKVNAGAFLGVPPLGTTGNVNHGLAGSGILVGDRNAFGINGMVDEAGLKLISHPQNGAVPNSIVQAALNTSPGDVIMSIDSIWLLQLGSNDYVPGEYYQATFDAIQTVTANGWFVVNTATNGFRSLDDPRLLQRFDLNYRDSGAIMAAASDGGNQWRATYTNYGSRVDANGWGEFVVTTGYGTLFFGNADPRQTYTAAYSGNSAATPIVTAAVTSLIGAARWQLDQQLTWQDVRQILRTHGTAFAGGIGNRPDLRAIFTAMGILDGLEMSTPDVPLAGTADVLLSGPAAGGALLFASFDLASYDIGLNRNVHLGNASLITLGYLPLVAGSASFPIQVPNDPVLKGSDLFVQALTFDAGGGNPHVTNSGQVTVY